MVESAPAPYEITYLGTHAEYCLSIATALDRSAHPLANDSHILIVLDILEHLVVVAREFMTDDHQSLPNGLVARARGAVGGANCSFALAGSFLERYSCRT